MAADQISGTAAPPEPAFHHRVLTVAGVALLGAAVAWAFYRAADVFFLLFAAVLLGVLLRGLSGALDRGTGLGPRWALVMVVVALLAVLGGAGWVFGDVVAKQTGRVADELPRAADRAREYLSKREWGRQMLDRVPPAERVVTGGSGDVTATATKVFATTLGVVVNVLVVAFVGVYLAAEPRLYTEGTLRLLPPDRRARGREVLVAVGHKLERWLLARIVAMAAVGVMVGVGLWIIGLPEFLALAILAALLDIVPFFGPLVAAIPAVLLALLLGPDKAGWVVALYLAVQTAESYVISPVLQQHAVRLPPALALAVVVLAWALFGVIAVLVVTPLTVAVLVAVQKLYSEDVLGECAASGSGSSGRALSER